MTKCGTTLRRVCGCYIVLCSLPASSVLAAQRGYEFYVSPKGDDKASGTSEGRAFLTLSRARDAVRRIKRDGRLGRPVTIHIGPGIYSPAEPLTLTSADSGTVDAPITYAGHGAPLLSGGRKITSWKRHAGNVWKAELPDVRAGKWRFRQLYVDGQQRRRARIPNEGFLRVAGFPDGGREVHYHTDCQRFQFSEGDIDPEWTNLDDVEVIVYHFWTDSHLPIKSIDTEKNIVTFQQAWKRWSG